MPNNIDGFHKKHKQEPDLRPDHDLPAPKPTPLIEEHEQPKLDDGEESGGLKKTLHGRKKWLFIVLGAILAILIAVFLYATIWYQQQLSPVSSDTSKRVKVLIKPGTTPILIAEQLKSAGVIRSRLAFTIYTKLTGTENKLKAGAYNLQPSLPTPTIVDQLVEGKQDTYALTFLPGDTLANNRKALIKAGFSEAEVDAALAKTYNRPLFADKPEGADLEGYIFGETYEFTVDATVETVLNRTFDEFESIIDEHKLGEAFKKQGLNLFEGITLASIVQRETSNPESQRQVAKVFLNRMKIGMMLGSDVTYQYIADKTGVPRDPGLDSPYNTRKYAGLPPGPIAAPGESALLAVANPGNNDYLFFLAGDDHKMHYAKTDAEHQQNIVKYCQKKCSIL